MAAQGLPCSIAGLAKAYEDFLDLLICDSQDAAAAEALRKNGLRVECRQTIMRSFEDRVELARAALLLTAGKLHSGEIVSHPASDDLEAGAAAPSP